MKKITKQFLFCALSLSTLAFVSCDDKDDATGSSTLEVTEGVVGSIALSAPLAATNTVNESDEGSYSYTVTLDKAQSVDVHVTVKQIAGSADDHDFEFDSDLVIPAYATSATGTISILSDDEAEGVENFTLQIGDVNTSNASLTPKTVSFTINNNLSTDLELTLNFQKSFVLGGTDLTMCGIGYDMDFYILDVDFNDTGIYDAAASGCPEAVTMDPARFPDGTYYVFYDIWETGNVNGGTNTATDGLPNFYHEPFVIPITVDYKRVGGINAGNFHQESEFAPSSTSPKGTSDYVVTIEILNGVYTLKNSIDQVIVSGRSSGKIKASIDQARFKNRK